MYGEMPAKTKIVLALVLICFLIMLSKALVYMLFNLFLIMQLLSFHCLANLAFTCYYLSDETLLVFLQEVNLVLGFGDR